MGKRKIRFSLDFQALRNSEGAPVSEIQLFKKGNFVHWSGEEFNVDDDFIAAMVENFEAMRASSKDPKIIPIDYNHSSLATNADDAKAAGWVVELAPKKDGLYARVEWTKAASEYIKNEEYRYISPEFAIDVTDEYGEDIEGAVLYAAALTNRPFLKGMGAVSLSVKKTTQKEGNKVQLKQIGKTLGLSEKATEEEITQEIERVLQINQEVAATIELSEGESPVEKLKSLVSAKKENETELEKLNEKVAKLSDEQKTLKATQEVEKLIEDGRLKPAYREEFIELAKESNKAFGIACKALPESGIFKVEGSGATNGDGEKDETLPSVVKAYQIEKGVSYKEAYQRIKETRPELAKAHAESV